MFTTIVNFNTKIKEALSFGQPISEYDPASKGRVDFRRLAEEIASSGSKQLRHELVNSLADQLASISASADELLQTAKPAPVVKPAAAVSETSKQEQKKSRDTDARLSDYYGVNQINDAVAFVTLYPRATSVQVAGDFNNWDPSKTPMEKIDGTGMWQTKINLPKGRYRYRLVVDNQWQQDPYNESTEPNPFGGFNSVLEVK